MNKKIAPICTGNHKIEEYPRHPALSHVASILTINWKRLHFTAILMMDGNYN